MSFTDKSSDRKISNSEAIGSKANSKKVSNGNTAHLLKKIVSFPIANLTFLFFIVNTAFWCTFFLPLALYKAITRSKLRGGFRSFSVWIAESWVELNNFYLRKVLRVQFEVELPIGLSRSLSYLVFSNHISWVDILALQSAMNRKLPFFRFFLKDSLKWVPLLGIAWKTLDYPFMKRYSSEELALHPEKKGRDLMTAREACRELVGIPASILIFIEGTRFTEDKRKSSNSPYQFLLKPKIGGACAALDEMREQISSLLDVTIIYPEGTKDLWGLFSGEVRRVVVRVKEIQIPTPFMKGNLCSDSVVRKEFERWVEGVWQSKDSQLVPFYGGK